MPEQIKLIRQVLDYMESYKKDVGNTDIKEFAMYLRDRVLIGDDKTSTESFDKEQYLSYKQMPKVEFSTLLTTLYRFARIYVKKAFQNTSIKTIDEFGFLASILKEKNLLKNELIKMHFMEVSSGSEILKRLIRNGLVYEYPDSKDGRAKRVSLMEKGFKEIMNAFDEMHKVSEIVVGNLSGEELKETLAVFNKLNFFHMHIHEEAKDDSLDEIHQNYIINTPK